MKLWIHIGLYCVFLFDNAAASPAIRDTSIATLQSLSQDLPSCALQCFADWVPETKCGLTDLSCVCTKAKLDKSLSSCVTSKCSIRESLAAIRVQSNACGLPTRDQSLVTRCVEWSFFGLAAISVVLRLLARTPAFGGPGYGWDDWSILGCLALLVPLNVMLNIMLDLGLGQDIWILKPQDITGVLFYFWVEEFVYCAIVLLTKVSILLLYLRLFPVTDTASLWFRRAILGLISITGITLVSGYFTILFQCHPINFAWLRWDDKHSGTCINTVAQISALAGLNILLDLLVFLLPIPKLLKLRISTSKKIGVAAMFLTGLFVTVCSAVRLQYILHWQVLLKLTHTAGQTSGRSTNPTWQYNPLAVWSSIECNLGVALACMPLLTGLFKRIWKRFVLRLSMSNDSNSSIRRRPHDSKLGEADHYDRNEPVSKSFLALVSPRRLEATDEVELIGRAV